jgi:molybdenum cofactor cytidylyltransferase
VVSVAGAAGVDEIVVVSGGAHAQLDELLQKYPLQVCYNPDYAEGEMLSSLQCGLKVLGEQVEAVLIMLGDQPQVQVEVVKGLIRAFREGGHAMVVPSFRMRRGHPWIIRRDLWTQVLSLQPPATLRDFLNEQAGLIQYLEVETSSILADIDTPEDYHRYRAEGSTAKSSNKVEVWGVAGVNTPTSTQKFLFPALGQGLGHSASGREYGSQHKS